MNKILRKQEVLLISGLVRSGLVRSGRSAVSSLTNTVATLLGCGLGLLALNACNPVEFNQMKAASPSGSPIALPGVQTETPADPSSLFSKGLCALDSTTTLLTCMTCLVPALPPLPPQFSKKGQALYSILTAACQIPNKSDPPGYVAPSAAELMRRLNRMSPTLYPDSQMSALQTRVVSQLLNDPTKLKEFFGGIFYSGVTAETTAFETYFGIETIEARWSFCYDGNPNVDTTIFTRTNSTPLHSKAWIDCQYTSDPFTCRETAEYNAANVYRNQLRNSMTESLSNPYKAGAPGVQQSCAWEKFSGMYGAEARAQIQRWQQLGFTVGGEFHELKVCGEVKGDRSDFKGSVTLAAYRCQ